MDDDKPRKRRVGTPVPGCPKIPSRREAHLHFLHKRALQNAKTGSTSSLISQKGCASLHYFCEKWGFELFEVQIRGFTLLLQALLNSDSHGDGHADHGVVACAQEASEARFRGGI